MHVEKGGKLKTKFVTVEVKRKRLGKAKKLREAAKKLEMNYKN